MDPATRVTAHQQGTPEGPISRRGEFSFGAKKDVDLCQPAGLSKNVTEKPRVSFASR